MSEKEEAPPTVGNVVGGNLKALRKQRRLTQDKAAALLVRSGLNWRRTHVSDIESGRRETVDLGALIALAAAWDVSLPDLFAGDGSVLLTPRADYAECRVTASRAELRAWCGGGRPLVAVGGDRSVPEAMAYHRWRGRSIPIEADRALADKLGVRVEEVVETAELLWDRSLTEERDRLVGELGEIPLGERQARQGHIMRRLNAAVTKALGGAGESADG